MKFRILFAAAVSLAFLPSTLEAQGFRYAPGDATYEASVVTRMTREMNGQRMEDEVTQRQRLRVSLRERTPDTLQIGITLDTASVVARSGPQDVSQLIGLEVEGQISPLGQVYSSEVVTGNLGLVGPMIAGELVKLLPRVRSDLRQGLTWTDTTTERVNMLGVPIERRTITVSTVAGDTAVAGERAWRIDRTADVSFTGTGTLQGQQLTLDGSSVARGHILVGRSGRYLGSVQTDSVTTNFSSGAMAFSIRQTQETRVEPAR